MNKDDLNQLVTKQDLENFKVELSGLLLSKMNPLKEFYSPKEFHYKTGIPYSTVIYKCTNGTLRAFQESPNCSWLIYGTELERLKNQADENFNNY
jgi:hypothetical protein|tara:strand:+ start:895 stop:1179 length:285 start_codon:yes stop_codon:yes gene_type:complete